MQPYTQPSVLSELKQILLAVLVVALLLGLCRLVLLALYFIAPDSRFDADYKAYAGEFDPVAEYVLSLCPNPEECRIFSLHRDREARTAAMYNDGDALPLPEDVSEALYVLPDAFPQGAALSYLWVGEGRVEFHPDTKPYALVYSPSGRPKGERIEHVRHIKGAWYHVRFG